MAFLIQSVELGDYASLRSLALKYPLLNLPAHPRLLKEKIKLSKKSFAQALPREEASFLFVLKTKRGKVLATSQLTAKVGTKKIPSYSLKLKKGGKGGFLQLKVDRNGPSYIGGLVVDSVYRGQKLGKQISLIRFLFVTMYSELFESTFLAEVAPFLDAKGKNPFFESFILPRFPFSFKQIDYLTLTNKKKLFASYPKEKILLSSLSKLVQKTIGKPGGLSQRAEKLLTQQKFYYTDEVDPFDGGPYMKAKKNQIPLIRNTKKVSLQKALKGSHQKWLFGTLHKGQFKGGVIEGSLQTKNRKNILLVASKNIKDFSLKENQDLFITPFE